jgi:hypothetical protein
MKRNKVLTQPTRVSELSFDELYDSIAKDWQQKAEKLRIRRWRRLKQQLI